MSTGKSHIAERTSNGTSAEIIHGDREPRNRPNRHRHRKRSEHRDSVGGGGRRRRSSPTRITKPPPSTSG
ncbi:hypothetical protein QJS04_geneDACA023698 [Acorus gramineus]|uniref:Uncharacterized protein n=1 Tax=Acorus gramineus TaxID=55184 RepID=A0AAV9BQU1_ACOGR|nr:hypothetical protein QJS04_geneDACA023698 [Acorus gramineus]